MKVCKPLGGGDPKLDEIAIGVTGVAHYSDKSSPDVAGNYNYKDA